MKAWNSPLIRTAVAARFVPATVALLVACQDPDNPVASHLPTDPASREIAGEGNQSCEAHRAPHPERPHQRGSCRQRGRYRGGGIQLGAGSNRYDPSRKVDLEGSGKVRLYRALRVLAPQEHRYHRPSKLRDSDARFHWDLRTRDQAHLR